MGFSRGPKTATNGMVFYIDKDNVKSYKGEPTTNYVPGSFAYNIYAYASGPVDTTVLDENNRSITAKRYTITNAVNTARAAIYPTGLTTGIAYTFSFKWKYNGITTSSPSVSVSASKGYPEGNNNGFSSQSGDTVSIGNGWYLTTYTFVFSSNPTNASILTFGISTGSNTGYVNETFDVYEAQFEIKDHKTQYVDGTRSSTNALVDITRLQDALNINTVSFNSNAEMVFDGTDDYLPLPSSYTNASNRPQREITVNMMVKFYNFNNQQEIFRADGAIEFDVGEVGGGGSGRMSFWVFDGSWLSTDYNVATNIGTNKWFMATGVYTNLYNRHELYINGQLAVTGAVGTSTSLNLAGSGARIGAAGSGSNPFAGEIGVCQIYNRALSSDEILNNFHALKGRYGL